MIGLRQKKGKVVDNEHPDIEAPAGLLDPRFTGIISPAARTYKHFFSKNGQQIEAISRGPGPSLGTHQRTGGADLFAKNCHEKLRLACWQTQNSYDKSLPKNEGT